METFCYIAWVVMIIQFISMCAPLRTGEDGGLMRDLLTGAGFAKK